MKTTKAANKRDAIEPYSPSDSVRAVLRRAASTYDSPTEIAFDLQLIRGALNKCRRGNEILADTITAKIRELETEGIRLSTGGVS